MNRLEFLTDRYYKEIDRQSSLEDRLNIPIGILTGLVAVYFFLISGIEIDKYSNIIISITFLIIFVLSLACWISAAFNLFKSYNNLFTGYAYKHLPLHSDLNKYYDKLDVYISENDFEPTVTKDTLYEAQFDSMLTEYLDFNINNNDQKSKYLFRAKKYLLFCTLLSILCFIPFGFDYFYNRNNESVEKIYIQNIDELNENLKNIYNLNLLQYERQKTSKTDTTSTAPAKVN